MKNFITFFVIIILTSCSQIGKDRILLTDNLVNIKNPKEFYHILDTSTYNCKDNYKSNPVDTNIINEIKDNYFRYYEDRIIYLGKYTKIGGDMKTNFDTLHRIVYENVELYNRYITFEFKLINNHFCFNNLYGFNTLK